MNYPSFFLIGAPKAGTTSLVKWLNQHPYVYMSPVKEPHYFNTDMGNNPIKSQSEYARLFAGVRDSHLAVGEASVWYMYSKRAVKNILRVAPKAKFIVMLRDPAEMVVSLHEQLYFSGIESEKQLGVAWSKVDERRRGISLPRFCIEPSLLDYKSACAIGTQVKRITDIVDRRSILFISFLEVKQNPKAVFDQVQDFLRLPSFEIADFAVENGAKERKSRVLMFFVFYLNRFRRFLRVPRLNTGIMRKVDEYNRVYRARDVDKEVFQEIKHYFEAEKEIAEQLSGLKL